MIKFIYRQFFNDETESKWNTFYNIFMMITIIISLIPLAFKESNAVFDVIDKITVSIFIIDYILRWITINQKYEKGFISFIKYPFAFMSLIDILSILSSFSFLASGFKLVKLVRLIRTFKVFKAFKMFRYSKNVATIINVIKKQKQALITVFSMAFGYVLISALVIFNVEPNSFNNFFEAVYWATVSLTTVGYGDIYPVSDIGRIVTMVSSFIGIAIVALPAGIITAGYMEEISHKDE